MAGDYEIIQAVHIGDREIVVGENQADEQGLPYLVAYYESNAILGRYYDAIGSDDFTEIMEIYGQRIMEQAQKTRVELSTPKVQGIDNSPITAERCTPISYDDDLNGKVIVIKPEVLRPEYRRATSQVKLCTGGFGADPHSRGSAVFCTEVYTGRQSRFERRDVLGVLEPEDQPKPQEGFAGITILEQLYADKEAAGKAILDVCTKMTGSDAVFLGQYRGFSLVLSYDGPSNEYRMTMKGTLSHTAVLGADVFGNLTRMDNVIDGLSGKLEAVRAELADTQVQLENARTELAAPFAKEAELAEKTARLKELNILLNMDQKDKSLIDDVPDEDTPERSRSKGLER